MDDLFIVFVVLLTLLTFISALGGSIYDAETFAVPTYVSGKTKMSKHHAAGGMRTGRERFEDDIAVPMVDDDATPTIPSMEEPDTMPSVIMEDSMMMPDTMPDVTTMSPMMAETWEEDQAYMEDSTDAMPDILPDTMPTMPPESEMPVDDMPSMPTDDSVVEGFDGDMYAAF
jgi:hypothetical protein